MVKIIMHGCNGKMGQVISGLIAADPDMELVAGIDARDDGHNPYPVFTDIAKCDVAADCIIDFSAAVAVDKLLNYCVEKKIPCVLCTTGLSEAQLAKVDEAAKKVAILKSANMSLGINLMLKLLKEAAGVLANAGFDIEIVEKHHNLKVDAPAAPHWHWRTPLTKNSITNTNTSTTAVHAENADPRKRSASVPSEAAPSSATTMSSSPEQTKS